MPNLIVRNILKALVIFLLASLAFVCLITLFPLISSLWTKNLDIGQIIKDNFSLLAPLSIMSVIVSPLFGLACRYMKKHRIVKLIIMGVISIWIATLIAMVMQANTLVAAEGIYFVLFASLWAVAAFSFYSIPILIPALIILERWTRIKGEDTQKEISAEKA